MKRVIRLFTALVLLFCLTAVPAPDACAEDPEVNPDGITRKLAQLKLEFPDGAHWNHRREVEGDDGDTLLKTGNNAYGYKTTNEHCYIHGGICPIGEIDCNAFDGAIQCMGFANMIFYRLFGVHCYECAKRTDKENISIGDHIRFGTWEDGGHSAIVMAKDGDSITLLECNFLEDPCVIRWGFRTVSISGSVIAGFYHAPNWQQRYDDIKPPVISDYSDFSVVDGYFTFAVTDDSEVDKDTVKVKIWEEGQDENAAEWIKANEKTENTDCYTVYIGDLTDHDSVYYYIIHADDVCGRPADARSLRIPFYQNGTEDSSGLYRVSENSIAVHLAPYDKINGVSTTVYHLERGVLVSIVGQYHNTYNHTWYQLGNGSWIYSENVERVKSLQESMVEMIQRFLPRPWFYVLGQYLFKYSVETASVDARVYTSAADFSNGVSSYNDGYTLRISNRGIPPEACLYGPDSGVSLLTVTFDGNHGLPEERERQIYEGNTYGYLPDASRFGYVFLGWFTDPNEGTQVLATDVCTESRTLYAHWAEITSDSGTCGENLTWTLYEYGLLRIEGSGAMTSAPWYTRGLNGNIFDVSLPEGLTQICANAFKESFLNRVDLPSTLTHIGSYAFYGCGGLTDLTLPAGLTDIGDYAFYECGELPFDPELPAALTNIGEYAFCGCRGLTGTLTIPGGVTRLKTASFKGCSGITGLVIPNSATNAEPDAFADCTGLRSVTVPAPLLRAGYGLFGENTHIVQSVETLHLTPGATGTIPASTGTNAYRNQLTYASREHLTSVILDEGITSIGDRVFYECGAVTDLTLPSTLTYIGGYAFYDCGGLTDLTLPGGLTYVGDNAFYGCGGLGTVYYPSEEVRAFMLSIASGNAALTDAEWIYGITGCLNPPAALNVLENGALYGTAAKQIVLPETLQTVGTEALGGSSALRFVIVKGTETAFADGALTGSTNAVVLCRAGSAAAAWCTDNGVACFVK